MLVRLALKNLKRRRVRTLLTICGIAFAITALFCFLSLERGYKESLGNELTKFGANMLAIPKGCPYEATAMLIQGGMIPKYLSENVTMKVEKIKYVSAVSPILQEQIFLNDKIITVIGITDKEFKLKPWWKVEGSLKNGSAILGSEFASRSGLKIGDSLSLQNYSISVSGVLMQTGSKDDYFIYLPLNMAQKIFSRAGEINAISIFADTDKIATVTGEIERIEDVQVVTVNQILGAVNTLISSGRAMVLSVTIIAILVSALGVANTMLMSVFERTKEIGLMKAVGASDIDIFKLIFLETLCLSLIGGSIGIFAGVILSNFLGIVAKFFFPIVPTGSITSLSIDFLLICLVFSIATGTFSSLYPAFRASKTNPIQALRSE